VNKANQKPIGLFRAERLTKAFKPDYTGFGNSVAPNEIKSVGNTGSDDTLSCTVTVRPSEIHMHSKVV
jgi:hypothetical protein